MAWAAWLPPRGEPGYMRGGSRDAVGAWPGESLGTQAPRPAPRHASPPALLPRTAGLDPAPRSFEHRTPQAKERGFLSGTLALPAAQLDSIPKRAFADLVVCVHQAKIHEGSLQARQRGAQGCNPTQHEAATP